jgi:hypothetical protein
METLSEKQNQKGWVYDSSGRALLKGPEFNPQYSKRTKQNKKDIIKQLATS